MKKSQKIKDLESLASSQWGMFTTAQAKKLGVQRNQIARMVDADQAENLCYGVYGVRPRSQTRQEAIKAAWMSVNPKDEVYKRLEARPHDAIIAGRTAASMHAAGNFHSSPYTFAVPRRKQTSRADIRYLLTEVDPHDVVMIDGLPVTRIERTVYDLLRTGEDPDLVEGFIRDASSRGHRFDRARLAELLSPLALKYGYESKDGETFVYDLLGRNVGESELSKAAQSMSDFANAIQQLPAMRQLDDAASKIRKAFEGSSAYAEFMESTERFRDEIAKNESLQNIQEQMAKIPIPEAVQYREIETLARMAKISALQLGDFEMLSRLIIQFPEQESQFPEDCNSATREP